MVTPARSIETKSSWIAACAALLILTVSFGAPWILVVALKLVAAEVGGGARSVPAFASALGWLGQGVGGIIMGRVADKVGVRWTVMFGCVMICIGLLISAGGAPWQLCLGHGVFIGLLGNGGINAPFYVYVSRLFDIRRGSALALISSGTYFAGAIWPNVFEPAIAEFGWRQTMVYYGLFEVSVILPLAILFLNRPPEQPTFAVSKSEHVLRILGWPPSAIYVPMLFAAFLCCVTMSIPQSHLVALCSDLGVQPSHGAAMLSLLLGAGFLSRQIWGLVSDRIGGIQTLLASSACQGVAMLGFVFTQNEVGLFAVAAAFGFGFAGLVPAYVLTLRELFPASEASWRIPVLLLCNATGMGTGSWLGGVLYDYFGYYAPAFAAGVAANVLNFALISMLAWRQRYAGHGLPA